MDNTVGSLSQFQKSVIIGTVLGDGYLRQLPGRKNTFLEINHCLQQKQYVDWLFEVLSNICLSSPKSYQGNGERQAYRFFTRQHPYLTKLLKRFYNHKRKVVPDNLKVDWTVLSVWYMDDGSKCGDYSFYLNTQQFSMKDQLKLIKKLRKMNLKARLNKDKQYHRIRFLQESTTLLKKKLKDKVVPSMQYKLR